MKKKFLILAFFGIISSCFCQEIYYEVKVDTGLFENDGYPLFKIEVQYIDAPLVNPFNFEDTYALGKQEE